MAKALRFVVGIDQGTTSTKAFRLRQDGEFVPLCSVEHRQFYPQAGWVEHDPLELLAAVGQCLDASAGATGIGLDNQGETVVAWHAETGVPLYRAIVWQDNRTRTHVEQLRHDGAEPLTRARAGLPLDSYFAASKLRWLLDHAPDARRLARQGLLRLGTSDAFFLDRLCGVYATDVTTASRTSLMNLATGTWDPELCRLFGVPINLLPPILPSVHPYGVIRGCGLPLTASIVDQQAALFGHGCHAPGDIKITFGTGAFALAVAGDKPPAGDGGMLPTVAWRIGTQTRYAIDGGVYNAASALNWVRGLGLFTDLREIDSFPGPTAIERGIVFVPALSGLACPYWDRSASGLWLGMGLETTRNHMLQAVLEGIALRSAQALTAMDAQVPLAGSVSVDGGLSHNRYFCDFLARALGREIVIPSAPELTGLGCAQLAFVGSGLGPIDGLPPVPPPLRTIAPTEPLPAALHARFADAVTRSRGWRTD
jgi:glycerol kinase